MFPNFPTPNRPCFSIKEGLELMFNTHLIWSLYLTTHLLYSFSFSSSIVRKARATWRACILGRRATLGMNIKRISSIVMLSYHLYSCVIELEYSCLIIIIIYELAYSLCVIILTCSTSCLIIHRICMSRSRARVGVTVRCSSSLTIFLLIDP